MHGCAGAVWDGCGLCFMESLLGNVLSAYEHYSFIFPTEKAYCDLSKVILLDKARSHNSQEAGGRSGQGRLNAESGL